MEACRRGEFTRINSRLLPSAPFLSLGKTLPRPAQVAGAAWGSGSAGATASDWARSTSTCPPYVAVRAVQRSYRRECIHTTMS